MVEVEANRAIIAHNTVQLADFGADLSVSKELRRVQANQTSDCNELKTLIQGIQHSIESLQQPESTPPRQLVTPLPPQDSLASNPPPERTPFPPKEGPLLRKPPQYLGGSQHLRPLLRILHFQVMHKEPTLHGHDPCSPYSRGRMC